MCVFDDAYSGFQDRVVDWIDEDRERLRERDSLGCSLIICAASGGQTSLVQLLFELLPESVNDRDSQGMTPFYHATAKGHVCTMKLLVRLGCDVMLPDFSDRTPLFAAIVFKSKRGFDMIMQLKPESALTRTKAGYLPVHVAAEVNNKYALRSLLKMKTTKPMYLERCHSTKETPLHIAVRYNSQRCAYILLEKDIAEKAVLMVDKYDRRPMDYAIMSGNVYLMGVLLKHCALDIALLSGGRRVKINKVR